MRHALLPVGHRCCQLLGAIRTENEALTLVRSLVAHYGQGYAEDLVLSVEFDDWSEGTALSGAALLARTEACLSQTATS